MLSHQRRIALLLGASPFVLALGLTAACSDDANEAAAPPTAVLDSGATPFDAGTIEPADGAPSDAGLGDADSGPVATCVGNPLTADGGVDGGLTLDAGAVLNSIASGPFLDGLQWVDDGTPTGSIVYSEVNAQTVVRNAPDGGDRVPLRDTGLGNLPIGNAVAGGFIFTAVSATTGGGAILRMQLDGGNPLTFDAGPVNSPNDIVGSAKNFVYFTDPGFQAPTLSVVTGVYRLNADGTGITPVQQFDAGANPGARADGIALSADGTGLFVSFFDEKRITRYSVDASGVASNPQDIVFTPADSPTGIAIDFGGNVWIAESDPVDTNLRGRVEVIESTTGKKWGEIPFADSRPTGVAFGGADSKTVYITTERNVSLGTLYTYASRCAGVR